MHIGIVLHPFGDSAKGLEQYIYETTRAILKESGAEVTFTVFVKGTPDTSEFGNGVTIVNLPDTIFWKFALFKWSKICDTFVFFTESAPVFLWRKSIIVFLDAAYYYFYGASVGARIQREVLVLWRSHMLRTSQHVVTISEASKKDLIEKFSVPAEHISVIYPGFKVDVVTDVHVLAPDIPFFIYVGPIKERKNVFRIVEAYIEFRQTTNFTHNLYLVGRESKGTYESRVRSLIEGTKYKDSIISKTNIDDTGLYNLYRTTTALVYSSLLEGFGLPILEAVSVGCTVITSNTTSTSEVLGNSGFLVNPNNTSEIVKAMVQVAEGDYDKEQFMKEGNLQCHRFSWEKSALEWKNLFSVL